MAETIEHEIGDKGAYIGWGRGKYHVYRRGDENTGCGKPIPKGAQLRTASVYRPDVCKQCEKHAPDMVAEAEAGRAEFAAKIKEVRTAELEKDRAGKFTVYRCKQCGRQVTNPHGNGRGAYPACDVPGGGFHISKPEPIEIQGPEWVDPHDVDSSFESSCDWGVKGCIKEHEPRVEEEYDE